MYVTPLILYIRFVALIFWNGLGFVSNLIVAGSKFRLLQVPIHIPIQASHLAIYQPQGFPKYWIQKEHYSLSLLRVFGN